MTVRKTQNVDDRGFFSRYKIELFYTTSAALCMFSVGINSGWPGPVLDILSNPNSSFYVDLKDTAWLASLFSIGCIFGATIGMYSSKLWSRSKTLLAASIPFMISYIIFAFWQKLYPYYAARIISGISAGICWGTASTYATEIASVEIRGLLGLIMSVASGIGIVTPYVVVPLMNITSINYVFFGVALVQFIFCWFLPESPHLLLMKNRNEEAKQVLIQLRGTTNVEDEYLEVSKYVKEQLSQNVKWSSLVTDQLKRRSIALFTLVILAQQFTGTGPIISYSQRLFDTEDPLISKEVSGIIYSSFILISHILSSTMVDRLGRKKLLVFSSTGCAVPLICLGVFFYLEQKDHTLVAHLSIIPLLMMLLHMLVFGLGCGALPYLYMTEIVSTNIRPQCAFLITVLGATSGFVCVQVFNLMDREIGKWAPMFLFAFTTLSFGIIMAVFLIETKGKTFPEIENSLAGRKK